MENQITGQKPILRRPVIFSGYTGLVAAESTRHGGVSPAPYATLNLGINTDDTPENVSENLRRFAAAAGFEAAALVLSRQVHGNAVLQVETPGLADGYDALITDIPGMVLGVTVADCAPVLVYDPVQHAVAAIHAGWRGAVAGIVQETLAAMTRAYGTRPADCLAYIGTCIDANTFEVGPEVAVQFKETFVRNLPGQDKCLVDLKRAIAADLIVAGVEPRHIELSSYSTFTDHADYFSYRLEKGVTGRMLAIIGLPA